MREHDAFYQSRARGSNHPGLCAHLPAWYNRARHKTLDGDGAGARQTLTAVHRPGCPAASSVLPGPEEVGHVAHDGYQRCGQGNVVFDLGLNGDFAAGTALRWQPGLLGPGNGLASPGLGFHVLRSRRSLEGLVRLGLGQLEGMLEGLAGLGTGLCGGLRLAGKQILGRLLGRTFGLVKGLGHRRIGFGLGLFGRGARFEERLNRDLWFKLKVLGTALYEGRQLLRSSAVVQIGRNCVIDPDAIIHGPTTIGDNVTIGANAVIENCIIGDNVNISQGCQLMLSVVGDGTFLPFRASLFMTTVMENSLIAQNTCLQMCVVGRNTFIGAGSTWTDFNLLSAPIKARDGTGALRNSNRIVLGGCVGHNCRIGAGMLVYPARTIESDVVIFSTKERRVIDRDLYYEDSDHLRLPNAHLHPRLYPRPGEKGSETW